MSTIELRHIIAEHLLHIDDHSFLQALKTIAESKLTSSACQLSDFQIERLDAARQELKTRETISHHELQNEINQWLEE